MKAVALLLCSLVASVFGQIPVDYVPQHPLVDNSTFANLDYVRVTHQFVDWFPNFTTTQLQGSIVMDLQVLQQVMYVQLDVANCTVTDVQLLPPGSAMSATMNKGIVPVTDSPLEFTILSPNPVVGDVLVIALGQNYTMGQVFSINVVYSTDLTSKGVNWVSKDQTANGNYGMMYTYSYTILGRQIAPQMDSPSNRITWGGCITAPEYLASYLSGNQTGIYQSVLQQYKTCFFQQIPAPNYLMNAIVGDLEYATPANSVNVGIIAESSTMPTALSDFALLQYLFNGVQAVLEADYIWGQFNIVIMPPNFPEGGMSNPMLAFVSPTTLTGDGSQAYVILRMIAECWTGNAVTPSNWEDMWLNAGITTFIEREAVAQLYGRTEAMTGAFVGNSSLMEAVNILGANHPTYLTLHPVLQGDNPNNAVTIVPYEKGFQLLIFIQDVIMGWVNCSDFMNYWVTQYNLKSVNAFTGFRKAYNNFLETAGRWTPEGVNLNLLNMMYDDWIYAKGAAPTSLMWNAFLNPDVIAAQDLANAYVLAAGGTQPAGYENYAGWYPQQKVVFMQTLIQNIDTDLAVLQAVQSDLDINSSPDPQVLQRWFSLGCYYSYTEVITLAGEWVSSMGRNQYIEAVYGAMRESPDQPANRNTAIGWLNANLDFYAPTTIELVQTILGLARS